MMEMLIVTISSHFTPTGNRLDGRYLFTYGRELNAIGWEDNLSFEDIKQKARFHCRIAPVLAGAFIRFEEVSGRGEYAA